MELTPSKILQAILGALVAVGFIAVTGMVMFFAIPESNKETLLLLIGQLSGAFVTVIGFAFGSSVGSQRKDESVYLKEPK